MTAGSTTAGRRFVVGGILGLLLSAAAAVPPALATGPATPGAPQATAGPTAIYGRWRGTSLCVDLKRTPACKDEVVMYDFTPRPAPGLAGGKVGSAEVPHASLKAYKVVNGETGLMGEGEFVYDVAKAAWTWDMKTERYHGLWTFTVRGDSLKGTLVDLPSKALIRRVAVRREQ